MKSFREYLNESRLDEADILVRSMSKDRIKDIIDNNKNTSLGETLKDVTGSNIPGCVFVEYDNDGLVYVSKNKITLLSINKKEEITIYVDTKKLKSVL
jgi:hypothetical protein